MMKAIFVEDVLHGPSTIRLHRHNLSALGGRRRKGVPAIVEAHVQRTTSVHVVLEFGDGSLCFWDLRELDDTASLGARAIEQNFG